MGHLVHTHSTVSFPWPVAGLGRFAARDRVCCVAFVLGTDTISPRAMSINTNRISALTYVQNKKQLLEGRAGTGKVTQSALPACQSAAQPALQWRPTKLAAIQFRYAVELVLMTINYSVVNVASPLARADH